MSRFSPRLLIPLLAASLAWSPLGVPATTRDSTSKALAAFGGGGQAFGWRAVPPLLLLQAGLWLPWWLLRP